MRKEQVTSAQNPKIKSLLALQEKSKARRESGLFVLEGRRELEHCLGAGYMPHTVFWCPEIISWDELWAIIALAGEDAAQDALYVEVPAHLYDKIALRGGTEGVVAQIKAKAHSLEALNLPEDPLVVVLESVEKPGNLGAVLRSADAAGADAVIVCDPLTDLYNPNLLRSSLGGIFTVPCAAAGSAQTIAFLKERGVKILSAQLQDSSWYYDTPMTGGTAIVIGTEATGLTQIWRDAADAHVKIPMLGKLDSLNASVSAAILLFEAVRQRHCKDKEL